MSLPIEVTEARFILVADPKPGVVRLLAYCSITINDTIAIHDAKIMSMREGIILVMPSRKIAAACDKCGRKNPLRARYCNGCGVQLDHERPAPIGSRGTPSLHADVVHPTSAAARETIESAVIAAYWAEVDRSRLPDYVVAYHYQVADRTSPPIRRSAERKAAC